MSVPPVDARKMQLRRQARLVRSRAVTGSSPADGLRFGENLMATIRALPDCGVISGYLAIADEIDLSAVMENLIAAGKTCCLPEVVASHQPLIFREWVPGDTLMPGPLKTCHPLPSAARLEPDVLLVPMLAFDRHGYRLGWGGGFYDRTLTILRQRTRAVVAIGVAYQVQQVDAVPFDPYDQCVDFVVTEKSVLRTGAQGGAKT